MMPPHHNVLNQQKKCSCLSKNQRGSHRCEVLTNPGREFPFQTECSDSDPICTSFFHHSESVASPGKRSSMSQNNNVKRIAGVAGGKNDLIDNRVSKKSVESVASPGKRSVSSRSNNVKSDAHVRRYRYHCPFCRKGFTATNTLQGHLVLHTGVKQFKCNLCSAEYAYKYSLICHLATAHQIVQ